MRRLSCHRGAGCPCCCCTQTSGSGGGGTLLLLSPPSDPPCWLVWCPQYLKKGSVRELTPWRWHHIVGKSQARQGFHTYVAIRWPCRSNRRGAEWDMPHIHTTSFQFSVFQSQCSPTNPNKHAHSAPLPVLFVVVLCGSVESVVLGELFRIFFCRCLFDFLGQLPFEWEITKYALTNTPQPALKALQWKDKYRHSHA